MVLQPPWGTANKAEGISWPRPAGHATLGRPVPGGSAGHPQ